MNKGKFIDTTRMFISPPKNVLLGGAIGPKILKE